MKKIDSTTKICMIISSLLLISIVTMSFMLYKNSLLNDGEILNYDFGKISIPANKLQVLSDAISNDKFILCQIAVDECVGLRKTR